MTHVPATIETLASIDADDLSAITALLDTLVRGDAALGWTRPPPEQEVGDLLRSLVAAGPANARVLVARSRETDTHGRHIAGFGYWRRYARPTLRANADLERLAVATEFAGLGIGRALLRELIRTAREAGCEQLTIDFRGDNTRAEGLYLSEGFTEYGRLPGFVAPDPDRRFDKVFQVLDLRR